MTANDDSNSLTNSSGGLIPHSGGGPATGGANTSSGGASSTGGTAQPSGGSTSTGGSSFGSGGDSSGGAPAGAGGDLSANGGSNAAGGTGGQSNDPVFHVFLLIGQSNMAGGAETIPEDHEEEARIRVLGYDDCSESGRTYNEWDTASPPLHACWLRGLGPGDYFAKTLLPSFPEEHTIGLVPVAIPGVDIDFFRKGVISTRRSEFTIPPDNHWDSAYDWLIERARLAVEAGGVIEGIIFHQGESDSGQAIWLDKVEGMVADLKEDLQLGDIPFIAGEMLRGGAADGHNAIIAQLPGRVPNCVVVSSEGLNGTDQFHFDAPGVRTLGQRYGEAMSEALGLGQ